MFLEEKRQGEAAPVKVGTPKLSEAIIAGHDMIDEYSNGFLQRPGGGEGRCRGCAIGAAWVALGRSVEDRNGVPAESIMEWLSEETGAPMHILRAVSSRHFGGEPRLKIARWLESQGY